MKAFLCGLLIAGVFTRAIGQDEIIQIDLRMAVANLRNDSLSGTAVFIQSPANDHYLLATAHLAKTMDKTALAVILTADLSMSFPITEFANPVAWQYHPTADLAVLKLNPKPLFFNKYLLNRFIPLDWLDSTAVEIPKDNLLTILGFHPGIRGSGYKPPAAFTSLVTNDTIRLDTTTLQTSLDLAVLENPSVSGYNGGPVFLLDNSALPGATTPMTTIRMVGFIRGRIRDTAARTFLTMSPAFYVREMIK